MDFIFFDLDGTLLNQSSKLSAFTRDTLLLLDKHNIAFTVATGRTFASASHILGHQPLALPQIYNNGVTLWHPLDKALSFNHTLTLHDIEAILSLAKHSDLTPFVSGIDVHAGQPIHYIFHGPAHTQIEQEWLNYCGNKSDMHIQPLEALDASMVVTNISMIGESDKVKSLYHQVNDTEALVAYSGSTREPSGFRWIDIHHRMASKGSAIAQVKTQCKKANIICFGDNDNDVSMFDIADECYAPANAIDEIKAMSTQVIGHHNEDGVAHFLRQRFNL